MNATVWKDNLRAIRKSLPRFMSILVIVLLGVAFFIGIRMSGPSMLETAATYFDKYNMPDGVVRSTYGLDGEDTEALAKVSGMTWKPMQTVQTSIMPGSETAKLFAYDGDLQTAFYRVVDGRLPEGSGEIALDSKYLDMLNPDSASPIYIGSIVEVSEEDVAKADEEPSVPKLTRRKYRVVGFVESPLYYERTSRGTDEVTAFGVVSADDMLGELYTEAYYWADATGGLQAFSETYEKRMAEVGGQIEEAIKGRPALRLASLRADLDERIATATSDISSAYLELDDGQETLDETQAGLEEAEASYEEGLRDLESGREELASAQEAYESGLTEFESGQEALQAGEAELAKAEADYQAGLESYEAGQANYQAEMQQAEADYQAGLAALEAGKQELATSRQQLEASESDYQAALSQLPDGTTLDSLKALAADLSRQKETLTKQKDALSAQLNPEANQGEGTNEALAEQIAALVAEQNSLEVRLTDINQQLAEVTDAIATRDTLLAEHSALVANYSQYEAQMADLLSQQSQATETNLQVELAERIRQLEGQMGEVSQALASVNGQLANYETIDSTYDALVAEQATIETDLASNQEQQAALTNNTTSAGEVGAEVPIQAQLEALEEGLATIEAQLAPIQELLTGQEELAAGWAAYEAGLAQSQQAEQELEAGRQALESGRLEGQAALDQAYAELEAGRVQLADGRQEVQANRARLQEAQAELASAQSELASGQRELADAEQELEEGRLELDDGWAEWRDGQETYRSEREEALADLQEAEDALEGARKQRADLVEPTYIVNQRSDLSTYSGIRDNSQQLDAISNVFPVIFFAIAILVTFTTVQRMVNEERNYMGTMEQLGYDNHVIISKFVTYAGLAAVIGTILGLIAGHLVFPPVILGAYNSLYYFGEMAIASSPMWNGIVALIALATAFVPAIMTPLNKLQTAPANLLRPEPPRSGKKIFLERFPAIWNRLSFDRKMTFRNLLRYKGRNSMTLLGVLGCSMLIVTGFGISDTIAGIVDTQFNDLQSFESMVLVNSHQAEALEDLLADLDDAPEVAHYTAMALMPFDTDGSGGNQAVSVLVPLSDASSFQKNVRIRERSQPNQLLDLKQTGPVMTERLAEHYGLSGEGPAKVTLTDDDYRSYSFETSTVVENYINHYIYMTAEDYMNIFGEEPEMNMLYINYTDEDSRKALEDGLLHDSDAVLSVVGQEVIAQTVDSAMRSLELITVVLIVSAAGLAFVVLYNLTNINISERLRELSTIKVLGFYDREVTMYIFAEILILTLLGGLGGLLAGNFLTKFLMKTMQTPDMLFYPQVDASSYIISLALTFVFSAIVMLVMHFKLKHIDMVEALKAVE